jgi:hypothetical protein
LGGSDVLQGGDTGTTYCASGHQGQYQLAAFERVEFHEGVPELSDSDDSTMNTQA